MNASRITENTPGSFLVIFGREEGDVFVVSHATPSRFYKSHGAAMKAARAWTARDLL